MKKIWSNPYIDIGLVKKWHLGIDTRFNGGNVYTSYRLGPIFIRRFWR